MTRKLIKLAKEKNVSIIGPATVNYNILLILFFIFSCFLHACVKCIVRLVALSLAVLKLETLVE